jgi:lipopolysaccharide assembly protein A
MQAVRTIGWVLATVVLVSFIAINWNHVQVNVWPQADGYYHFEWPVGFVAMAFFLIGFLPPWLMGRAARWSLKRRLESSERQLADLRAVANRPAEPLIAPPAEAPPPPPGSLL